MNDETNNDTTENIPITPIMAVVCDMHLRLNQRLFFLKEGQAARVFDCTDDKNRLPIPYDVLINIHTALLSRNELWTYEGNTSDPGSDEFLGYGMGTFTRVFFNDKILAGSITPAFFEHSRRIDQYEKCLYEHYLYETRQPQRIIPPSAYASPLSALIFQEMAEHAATSENLLPVLLVESGPDDDTASYYYTPDGYVWLSPVRELPLLLSLPYDTFLKRTPSLNEHAHQTDWTRHVMDALRKRGRHTLYVGMVKEGLTSGEAPSNIIEGGDFSGIYHPHRRKKLFPYEHKEPLAVIDKSRRELLKDILVGTVNHVQ